jgi:ABC-type uncharacterized transport system substrate-binding protein
MISVLLARPLMSLLLASVLWAAAAKDALAHPHVWITVESTLLHDKGTFTGLRHKWTFDEFYTAMAIAGLDKNNDGRYDRDELAELAKVNIDGLKEFGFFTAAGLGGQELKLSDAQDFWLEHKDDILSLHFTVPFEQPVLVEAKGLAFSVSDPTFFIAFDLAKADPVRLGAGAPEACKLSLNEPLQERSPPSALGESMTPQQLGAFAMRSAKTVSVDCNGS